MYTISGAMYIEERNFSQSSSLACVSLFHEESHSLFPPRQVESGYLQSAADADRSDVLLSDSEQGFPFIVGNWCYSD
jgi:hypothetical protein